MEHTFYFDDTPRPIKEKIARLVIKFHKKHGVYPTECLVLPSAIGELKRVGLVDIKPKLNALQDHFWLGVNDDKSAASSSAS